MKTKRMRKNRAPQAAARPEAGSMITGSKVILRTKSLADAADDYAWQSDSELARLDAAPQVTATFTDYLSDYTRQLVCPPANRYQFAIDNQLHPAMKGEWWIRAVDVHQNNELRELLRSVPESERVMVGGPHICTSILD